MNAQRPRRGRPRIHDQEGFELVDMRPPARLGPNIHPRDTIWARREEEQTWRQVLRSRGKVHNYMLMGFGLFLAFLICVCFTPGMFEKTKHWIPGNIDEVHDPTDVTSDFLASSFSPTLPTISPIRSDAKPITRSDRIHLTEHPTAASSTTITGPTSAQTWVPGFYLVSIPAATPVETMLPQRKSRSKDKYPPFVFSNTTILPSSNHRSFTEKGIKWCMENACNNNVTVARMCNNTFPVNRAEKTECDWCWDNTTHAYHPDPTVIYVHCKDNVRREVKTLWIVGCLCLVPSLIVMALILGRLIAHCKERRARSKRLLALKKPFLPASAGDAGTTSNQRWLERAPNNEISGPDITEKSPRRCILPKKRKETLKENKSADMEAVRERVPIMSRAIPHAIDAKVFANIRDMGQGRLLEGSNSQEDHLGLSRTSSRRERVLNSGSEGVPGGLMNRARTGSSGEEGQAGPNKLR